MTYTCQTASELPEKLPRTDCHGTAKLEQGQTDLPAHVIITASARPERERKSSEDSLPVHWSVAVCEIVELPRLGQGSELG